MVMGNKKHFDYLVQSQYYYHLLRTKVMFYRHTPYKKGGEDYLLARGEDPERAELIGTKGIGPPNIPWNSKDSDL